MNRLIMANDRMADITVLISDSPPCVQSRVIIDVSVKKSNLFYPIRLPDLESAKPFDNVQGASTTLKIEVFHDFCATKRLNKKA
jgi:hypothetical protein